MTAKQHVTSIAATVQELDRLAQLAEAQIVALGSEAQSYLEAVHTEKQAGENNSALSFACTKRAEMDAVAVKLQVASQKLAGIGADLRRRAP